MGDEPTQLALVMSGGGARCAYQAGFLGGLARRRPDLSPRILTGVSAGGINAAFLATAVGPFRDRVEALEELWRAIRVEDVFDARFASLLPNVLRWGARLMTGRRGTGLRVRGMVDTSPLASFLAHHLQARDGELVGVAENLRRGELDAVALTASAYATGQSITWVEGREIQRWRRAHRRSEHGPLRVEHVMASAALPLFFPAVEVAGRWYGDGGIRLTAPFSPAVHLGATRILALSIRHGQSDAEADVPAVLGYPPPAQIIGSLLNAIFLDQFDADALRLERLNGLLENLSPEERGALRPIELLVVRPSIDLGRLANECEVRLPGTLRFLTRGLGTGETRSNDFLSLLMFQPDYVARLLELGQRDADGEAPRIDAFLDSGGDPGSELTPSSGRTRA